MTQKEKIQLVHRCLKGMREFLYMKIYSGEVPEEWEGHELRQWIADVAASRFEYPKMSRRRLIAYHNDMKCRILN